MLGQQAQNVDVFLGYRYRGDHDYSPCPNVQLEPSRNTTTVRHNFEGEVPSDRQCF